MFCLFELMLYFTVNIFFSLDGTFLLSCSSTQHSAIGEALTSNPSISCADPESFARGGPTLTRFFFYESRKDPNCTKRGPSSARQLPPPPLKNHKNIGFLSNTGPDPLKNYKAAKSAFNVGPSSARQRNAI